MCLKKLEVDRSTIHKVFQPGEEIGEPWSSLLYQKSNGEIGMHGDGWFSWGQLDSDGTWASVASEAADGSPLNGPISVTENITSTYQDITISDKTVPADVDIPFAFGMWHGKELGTVLGTHRSVEQQPSPVEESSANKPENNKTAEAPEVQPVPESQESVETNASSNTGSGSGAGTSASNTSAPNNFSFSSSSNYEYLNSTRFVSNNELNKAQNIINDSLTKAYQEKSSIPGGLIGITSYIPNLDGSGKVELNGNGSRKLYDLLSHNVSSYSPSIKDLL